MQSTRTRVPLLFNTALAVCQDVKACGQLLRALESGEIFKHGLQQQQRLFSSALASQSGHPLFAHLATLHHSLGQQSLRQYAAAAASNAQPEPKQPKEQGSSYDSLELTQEKINAITDKIPQRPLGVVEGTSYTLIIIAAFGVLAYVLYQVLSSLIFEPTAITCFNHTLERLRTDPRITVRIGGADDIRAWGTNSESRVARQQIPHQIYKDANGVEHVRIQFYIRGPSGTGMVNADMYKDPSGQWQYSYLFVDAYPATGTGTGPQRLAIVTGGR